MSVTPGLSFGRAMVMTQSATAVTNTVPTVGPAIGVGLTYQMLGSWGYSGARTTVAVLVSGVWNAFAKLGLPILALALVLLQGGATGGRVVAALAGIAGLVAAIVVFALLLRSEELARRFGLLAGRIASRLLGLVGRPPVQGWESATVKFRTRTLELLEHGWVPITAATLVSHLSLYVVLLACLRAVGVSDAEVSWAQVLVVFGAPPATRRWRGSAPPSRPTGSTRPTWRRCRAKTAVRPATRSPAIRDPTCSSRSFPASAATATCCTGPGPCWAIAAGPHRGWAMRSPRSNMRRRWGCWPPRPGSMLQRCCWCGPSATAPACSSSSACMAAT